MDIRKLQRAIVDGLEDVKAQHIVVFNTEHLSPLFERVIIASGTSNRQTKALASSVKDAVKAQGFGVSRIEGSDNGEWIIVDCGAAVCHIMQPAIREYYHLEEIWGDKPVKLKLDTEPKRLPKASTETEPAPKKAAAGTKKTAAKKAGAPAAGAAKGAKTSTVKSGAAKTATAETVAKKTVAKKAAAGESKRGASTAGRSRPTVAKKAAPARAPAGAVRKTPAAKKPVTSAAAKKRVSKAK